MGVRVGVVGHVEVVEFAVVEHAPAAGEIVHASETFTAVAGGGAVAAVVLRELAGSATLRCALGDDALGDDALTRLRDELGLEALAARRPGVATRRGFTHLDDAGERTITVIGQRLAPAGGDALDWDDLAAHDGVYATAGDEAALRHARAARVVVATPRTGPALAASGITVDVLIGSANDPSEPLDGLDGPPPRAIVRTRGADGGTWETTDGRAGTWDPVAPPGAPRDAYGCGDAFAAALTYGLASGLDLDGACALAAREGARRLTLRGPYGRPVAARWG